MDNEFDGVEELSPAKRLVCNISAAVIILAAGLFLLLCGLDVFHIRVTRIIVGVMLAAVGLVFMLSAFISRNSVSLWLSFCFLTPALVELLVCVTSAGYSVLYPLYIAVPAVASLFTMLYTRQWLAHLWVVALFGVPAAIFALGNIDGIGWAVIVPALIIYIGCLMLVLAIKARKKDEDEH